MQLHFSIHYATRWGQHLFIETNNDKFAQIPLHYRADGWWQGELELSKLPSHFTYTYVLRDASGEEQREAGKGRTLSGLSDQSIHLVDSWRDLRHPDSALLNSAFEEVIFRPEQSTKLKTVRARKGKVKVQFDLLQVRVPQGLELALIGDASELGAWDAASAIALSNTQYPNWQVQVLLDPGTRVAYKYVLRDPLSGEIVKWEAGPDRTLSVSATTDMVIKSDMSFRFDVGSWKGMGVALPVFSLRTEQSCGIGEFTDLKPLVDWASDQGMQMVQILPVNDTTSSFTWVDSYPYSAISVFALHPIYLNLDVLESAPPKASHAKTRQQLNEHAEIDYEAVLQYKLQTARKIYDKQQPKLAKDKAFQAFITENAHWLQPYAAFCYLRDKYATADFLTWPSEDRMYDQARINALTDPKAKAYTEIAFHYYLQYHLDKQLYNAATYARQKGIVLKGDIPIGIDRESADAWVAPRLYNMDGQAGAPPDDFAADGQNWGFPTYDWEEMARDDYQWWKQRFTQLSRYFDAFRIDHILGFFRIWETPYEQMEGIMGRFNPALPIKLEEFFQRGVYFDYDRFCEPYINDEVLHRIFGEDANYVRATFLQSLHDRYQLKPDYRTQRQIHEQLTPDQQHLEKGLYQLVSNVLLFPTKEAPGEHFHPRISMHNALSFQFLDPYTQQHLMALHNDYFYHRQEEFWREQGMTKLPAMKAATDMLICGEDLGMVPACVPEVMDKLGILSLEIQRMSKDPSTEFLSESNIPYLSVCSPSTHDMSPVRLWWEEMEAGQRQRFYNQVLGWWGEAPSTCSPEVAQAILEQHLNWPTMWVVFPIQDLLAIDADVRRANPAEERINVPAIKEHYWRYRLHLSMEELQAAQGFNTRLRAMLTAAGRAS